MNTNMEGKQATVLRTAICRIMSEMLDNPDKDGIYPTELFMNRIEALLESMMVAPEVMQLSGSEALFGFVAWLTTADRFEQPRRNPDYGPTQDSAPWADMVGEFNETNHLSEPRKEWSSLLIHPRD